MERKNAVEEYVKKRGLKSNLDIALAWLGFMGGLAEEQIDIYILIEGEGVYKKKDVIRIALEDGMPIDTVKEISGLSISDIMNKRRAWIKEDGRQEEKSLLQSIFDKICLLEEQNEETDVTEGENASTNILEEICIPDWDANSSETQEEREELQKLPIEFTVKRKQSFFSKFSDKKKRNCLLKILCNPRLDAGQMEEIRLAYDEGLSLEDIRRIASPDFPKERMEKMRKLLLRLRGIQEEADTSKESEPEILGQTKSYPISTNSIERKESEGEQEKQSQEEEYFLDEENTYEDEYIG